jgi:hypothetical protein
MRHALPLLLSLGLTLSACGEAAPPPKAAEQPAEAAPQSLPTPKGAKVGFKDLKDGDTVTSPVTVCMTVEGIEVEPSGPVNPGKGHHHILVDIPVPDDLSKDIPKDAQNIHLGDGSVCKDVTLSPGKHTLRLLFADGSHRPYEPAITDTISVTVGAAKPPAVKPAEVKPAEAKPAETKPASAGE